MSMIIKHPFVKQVQRESF